MRKNRTRKFCAKKRRSCRFAKRYKRNTRRRQKGG